MMPQRSQNMISNKIRKTFNGEVHTRKKSAYMCFLIQSLLLQTSQVTNHNKEHNYKKIYIFVTILFTQVFCRQMDELVAHSHKFRVPMSERNGRRGLQRSFEYDAGISSPPPLLTLTHASHVATRPPGCSLKENQVIILIYITL